jgi:hypothetical protein
MLEDTKEATGSFFKLTNPDGTAFHDGQTKYALGKTVKKRKCNNPILCTDTVLHASRTLAGALRYAKLPLAIWKVEGDPVVSDHEDKCGFFALEVVKQIEPSDELLGFRYHEACHPMNPILIQNDVADADIADLKSWASVRASVWDSVRASVWASVGASVRDSVWDSVWASVWDSVGASVWDSVRASVRDSVRASVRASVWDSVGAYVGSLFPGIATWKYVVNHEEGVYPFESGARLWKRGFVPVKIGIKWHLYGWRDGHAVSLYQQTEEGF